MAITPSISPHTIARMDRLVVLDRGRIVEDGPHAILVNGGGLYVFRRQQGWLVVSERYYGRAAMLYPRSPVFRYYQDPVA
jgi:hypothetical protein